jgi:cytochrome c biogenesis protein ResB
MRTALILLLLLGVAAIPGSLFPQRNQNPLAVSDYFKRSINVYDDGRIYFDCSFERAKDMK